MIIGRDLRYVFMSTPKAATNSLYAWLVEHYGGVHDKSQPFHGTQVPDECRDFFKWTVVRNPYSRAVSIWWALTQDPQREQRWVDMVGSEPLDFAPFWDWVLTHHHDRDGAVCWSQVEWQSGFNMPPDMIISVEPFLEFQVARLPFVAQWMPSVLGLAGWIWPVPRLNETYSKRKPWRDYYTPEALVLVNRWGKVDAEAYGYAQVETVEELADYDETRREGRAV